MSFIRGSISTYEHGEYHVFEWRIQGFSTLDEDHGAGYYSPDFSFGGERWYLSMYPNGGSASGTSGHVDLCLDKYRSGRCIRVSLSLSLKTAKGERDREEHYTGDISGCSYNEFNRIISRSELTRRRSDLLPDDVLTVVCTMKRATSAGRNRADHSVAGPSVAGPSKSPILEHEAEDSPPPPPQQASARDPLRQPPELIAKVKQYFPREGIVSGDPDGDIYYWSGGKNVVLLKELGEVLPVPDFTGNVGMELRARPGHEHKAPSFNMIIPPRRLSEDVKLPHACFIYGGLFRRTITEKLKHGNRVRQVTVTKTPRTFFNAKTLRSFLSSQYNRFPYFLFDFEGIYTCYCLPYED